MYQYLRNFYGFYAYHQKCMLLPFHSIVNDMEDLEDIRERRHRFQYAFPFGIVSFLLIDTFYQYYTFGNNPKTFWVFHRAVMDFLPDFFLDQADIAMIGLYGLIFFCHAFLVLDKFPHHEFIYLRLPAPDGISQKLILPYRKLELQSIDDSLSRKLLGFYTACDKQIQMNILFCALQLQIAFSIPTVLVAVYRFYASNWTVLPDLRFVMFMIICPYFFRDNVTALEMSIRFMAQNWMINIKQQYYISELITSRNILEKAEPEEKLAATLRMYRQFRLTMEHVLDITREIGRYNAFYSPYMTATIFGYGIIGCCAMNCIVSGAGANAPFLQTFPWLLYTFIYFGLIALFNSSSSRTMYFDIRLFKKLLQLQIKLLSGRCLGKHGIVKLGLVNEYKLLLQKCAFRLLNSATLNNKLFFFQIFPAVSAFYMKLVTDYSE